MTAQATKPFGRPFLARGPRRPDFAARWNGGFAVGAGPSVGLASPAFAAQPLAAQPVGTHPLADAALSAELERRARDIAAAFDAIEPAVRSVAPLQFEPDFERRARKRLFSALAIDVPSDDLRATWSSPLDVRSLYAHCVLETFGRLVARVVDRSLAERTDEGNVAELVRRFGFHAVDITPCADGRLSALLDDILRIPPAIVVSRTSHAGAMFDVPSTLQRWEQVELRRYRESRPNPPTEPTRYLKVGVYHYSSGDPTHEGCAAHGHDARRAANAVLTRLEEFADAVAATHCCGAHVAILLVGVDTDNDAIRVHVPDGDGRVSVDRFVENAALYEGTRSLSREAAKDAIRAEVARCAGVDPGDSATEGMRWLCGYLLKNNIGQMAAVRATAGTGYADRGHRERLMVVGDPIDDVQMRNLAFQAQMDSIEEGAVDLDIGVRILRRLAAPHGLAVAVLAHASYDARIRGARSAAEGRALRLRRAILERFPDLAAARTLHVHAAVRGSSGPLERIDPPREADAA
jgi:carboxysome shell carbonic anhydrase